MKKILILSAMMLGLTACPEPCEREVLDLGKLSDEALAWSPYVNESSYSLKHSEGQEVSFECIRAKEVRTEYMDYGDKCLEVFYEVDITNLAASYPLFSLYVFLQKTDTASYDCGIGVGDSDFWLPTAPDDDFGQTRFDSLQIGDYWYKEVYKMGFKDIHQYGSDDIYADSLYYNKSHGVLKILMSNEEDYEISR